MATMSLPFGMETLLRRKYEPRPETITLHSAPPPPAAVPVPSPVGPDPGPTYYQTPAFQALYQQPMGLAAAAAALTAQPGPYAALSGLSPAYWTNFLYFQNHQQRLSAYYDLHHGRPFNPSHYASKKKQGGQIRFTHAQTLKLENAFQVSKYLIASDRKLLAQSVKLTDKQVKTWFQNRRAKSKKGEDPSKTESQISGSSMLGPDDDYSPDTGRCRSTNSSIGTDEASS